MFGILAALDLANTELENLGRGRSEREMVRVVFLADLMCSSRVRSGEGDLLGNCVGVEGGRVEFGMEEEELYAGSRSFVTVGALACVEGRGDSFSCEGRHGDTWFEDGSIDCRSVNFEMGLICLFSVIDL